MSGEQAPVPVDIETFDCTNHFLTKLRKAGQFVKMFLSSGASLTGKVKAFDKTSVLFFGAPGDETRLELMEEQLVARSFIVSIVVKQEGRR